MLKYVVTFLKVLASILGILVSVGTGLLVVDAASIRTGDITTDSFIDNANNTHMTINITLISAAYVFEARDGNLTLVLKTNTGDIIDTDSESFYLPKGQLITLNFELIIPPETALEAQAGNIKLLLDVHLSFWEAYGNYKLLNLSLRTTQELSLGGS